jgi:hypothetical protein
MRIVETGNNRPSAKVDNLRIQTSKSHYFFIGADRGETPIFDRYGTRDGTMLILGCDPAIHTKLLPAAHRVDAAVERFVSFPGRLEPMVHGVAAHEARANCLAR